MKTYTKTIVLGETLTLALSLFFACSSQKANSDLDNTSSIEIGYDSLIKKLEMDLLDDPSACQTDNPQGLCCLSAWNLDSNDESQILNNDLYNAFSFSHSIWADYEIWARTQMSGSEQLVPTDGIIFAIENISAKKLGLKHQHEAEKFQKEMVWFINNGPEKWSEDRFPLSAYNKYYDFVVDNIEHFETSKVYNYFSYVDALISKYDSVQKEIEAIQDDSTMINAICQKIEGARSFDEQCAITLACSMKSSTFRGTYSIDLMSSLLNSGKYSILLERMWILWRAFSQSVLGRSRDAVIPNYSYDRMRKQVYTTISKHVKENPQDTNAITCGLCLINHPGMVRNGDYMFGNDADVDIMNYCPDFYGHTAEDEDE